MDHQVRVARITDVDRLMALSGGAVAGARGSLAAQDLLRQLVFMPQASVFVAERRREVIGGAILTLRPSVRAAGYVGTVDLLVVDPSSDVDGVTASLVGEVLRSAQNKGCTLIEVECPGSREERVRWERHGFVEQGSVLRRPLTAEAIAR